MSEKQESLMGLVADILNEREVILNIGERNGVTHGMHFAILEEIDYEIKDPETGEVLGNLPPREKIRVRVVELEEKFCVARTYEFLTKDIIGGMEMPRAFSFLDPLQYAGMPKTFRIGGGATYYRQIIPPERSIVKVGDPVRQVIEQ